MTSRHRTTAALLLALPCLMAPGRCGFALDFSETFLVTDAFDRVVLGADDGSFIATVYDRSAALLKRHTFGFEPSLGDLTWSVEDSALELEARCKYEGNCRFDHMLELPLGVAFDITMKDARVSIGYADGDIVLDLESGWFRGVRLRSANVAVELGEGDVTIDLAEPPETLAVDVEEGTVSVTVPPGTYRCVLSTGDGDVKTSGVTCDEAAASVLDVSVAVGDIDVSGG